MYDTLFLVLILRFLKFIFRYHCKEKVKRSA